MTKESMQMRSMRSRGVNSSGALANVNAKKKVDINKVSKYFTTDYSWGIYPLLNLTDNPNRPDQFEYYKTRLQDWLDIQ